MRAHGLAWFLCMALSVPAFGQQVAVQQPIVGITSVTTSVVVPNRGQTFLGGVSSAQSSRSRYGFRQPGPSVGLSRSSSSLSVGVTIVDLREMDEAILNSVPEQRDPESRFARHGAAIRSSAPEQSIKPTHNTESPAERAARFEQLARKAEAENRQGVASLHWQMAAKYGSTMARERLLASSR